jgi:GNAT superfamily N-acetyltransferase
MRELPPLFWRHYEELKDTPAIYPDPDWGRYMAMDEMGTLKILTARCSGVLIGYIFSSIYPHIHNQTEINADILRFWLDPVFRGGWFPYRWFKENDRWLRELGAKRVSVPVKNHFQGGRVGNIFRRLGYKPVETVWTK